MSQPSCTPTVISVPGVTAISSSKGTDSPSFVIMSLEESPVTEKEMGRGLGSSAVSIITVPSAISSALYEPSALGFSSSPPAHTAVIRYPAVASILRGFCTVEISFTPLASSTTAPLPAPPVTVTAAALSTLICMPVFLVPYMVIVPVSSTLAVIIPFILSLTTWIALLGSAKIPVRLVPLAPAITIFSPTRTLPTMAPSFSVSVTLPDASLIT